MGKIIGIDFGKKRIGLAITDNQKIVFDKCKKMNQQNV